MAFYSNSVDAFLKQTESEILGELVAKNPFSLEDLQKNGLKKYESSKAFLWRITKATLFLNTPFHVWGKE